MGVKRAAFCLILAAATCLAPGASGADEIELTRQVFVAPERSADTIPRIEGLYPGMLSNEARKALAGLFPEADIVETRYGVEHDGKRSVPFTARFHSWGYPGLRMNVFLTSPSAGNEVYAVTARRNFENGEGGDHDHAVKELLSRYGETTISERPFDPTRILGRARMTTMSWYFGGKRTCSLYKPDQLASNLADLCEKPFHKVGDTVTTLDYSLDRLSEYRYTAAAGANIILAVTIVGDDTGTSVTSMTSSFLDVRRRLLSAEADLMTLEEADATGP